jgi:hypothetical protein
MKLHDLLPLQDEVDDVGKELARCRRLLYEADHQALSNRVVKVFPDLSDLQARSEQLRVGVAQLEGRIRGLAANLDHSVSISPAARLQMSTAPFLAAAKAITEIAVITQTQQHRETQTYVTYLEAVTAEVESALGLLRSPEKLKKFDSDNALDHIKQARKLELQLHREAVVWLHDAWKRPTLPTICNAPFSAFIHCPASP